MRDPGDFARRAASSLDASLAAELDELSPIAQIERLVSLMGAMMDRSRADPVVRRFEERDKAGLPKMTPLDALGLQRYIAAGLCNPQTPYLVEGDVPADVTERVDGVPAMRYRYVLGAEIFDAPLFHWQAEIGQTAMESRVPDHVIDAELLALPTMFWTFERHLRVTTAQHDRGVIWGIVVLQRAGGAFIVIIGALDDQRPWVEVRWMRFGARYPDDFDDGSLLAMFSFLNSPYVEAADVDATPRSKSARRRLAPDRPMTLRVVRLRTPARGAAEATGIESRRRDWKVRWLVRGHHRAQWYPSRKAHKLIWIAPYIKGPGDRPLKPPVYVVSR